MQSLGPAHYVLVVFSGLTRFVNFITFQTNRTTVFVGSVRVHMQSLGPAHYV